jgi:hypothetical protein
MTTPFCQERTRFEAHANPTAHCSPLRAAVLSHCTNRTADSGSASEPGSGTVNANAAEKERRS